MNATEACIVFIRNWVPGVLCSKSNTCEDGFDCKQPGSKLTAFYCQRALLARKIEYDIVNAVDTDAFCKALLNARDHLAPMMSDDLNSKKADNSSWVGKDLVRLVNGWLEEHLNE